MKVFNCNKCGHTLFFENVQCLNCLSPLAFLPDELAVVALESAAPETSEAPELWRKMGDTSGRTWRLCQNFTLYQSCNFAVSSEDPQMLCVSCRQTRMAPDLSIPENQSHWSAIEAAKRRLFYTLAKLDLVEGHADELIFEFLADLPGQPVMTGHQNGVITLNIAEADDAERARRRILLHEPYRTLLGHLRHESGHYYWDRLILQGNRVAEFTEVFGDPAQDYAQALATYYGAGGAAPDWQAGFVSAYATAHPWEDWAETWAHYLHMVDLLETGASYATRIAVPAPGSDPVTVNDPFAEPLEDFDSLVSQWTPVTLLLNSLNRSLGQADAYPFALTPGALRKLRYVHDVMLAAAAEAPDAPAQAHGDAAPQGAAVVAAPAASSSELPEQT